MRNKGIVKAMDKILKLMLDGEALSTEQMGKILGISPEEVNERLKQLSDEGVFLGWRPVINPDIEDGMVHAAIELRINPERDGGFDRLAQRVSQFEQVDSCYLMSGAYDLLLFVKAKSLRGVASFVYEKLATIGGVASTATHFFLRTYKQQGFIIKKDADSGDRLIYSP